jgi:VIT1/CCC1 family predicted Fe2+/Mn2+ transporter
MVYTSPAEARAAVISTLECYVSAALLDVVADDITASHDRTIAFLLEHRHRIDCADSSPRLYTSALCIALGYFFGGLIPLLPYVFISDGELALFCSVVVMVFTLFGFGVGKTAILGERSWKVRTREGLKMVGLGGSAAAASVLCVRLVHQ